MVPQINGYKDTWQLYPVSFLAVWISFSIPLPFQNLFLLSGTSQLGALLSGLYHEQCYINLGIQYDNSVRSHWICNLAPLILNESGDL